MGLFDQQQNTNTDINFALWALDFAAHSVPKYDSPFSGKRFTRPQLLACLILKTAWGMTYRQIVDTIRASTELREALGLRSTPHFTTLESYANGKHADEVMRVLFDTSVKRAFPAKAGERADVKEGAMDASGVGKTSASVYFEVVRATKRPTRSAERRERARNKGSLSKPTPSTSPTEERRHNAQFIKISVIIACGVMLPLAGIASIGRSNDKVQAYSLIDQAQERVQLGTLYADKGFDSERLHEFCREKHGIESVIPPVARTADGQVHTKYRAQMQTLPQGYAKRKQIESFFSGLKRTTGSAVRARTSAAQLREALMKVICYGIRRF
jgi:hypothetical protein